MNGLKNELSLDAEVYQRTAGLVLGFHGCDKTVAESVLASGTEHLKPSTNDYDWLGHGIYFWLNDPIRAFEWAVEMAGRNPRKVREPYVIGAVIDLGECLNTCERSSVGLLQRSYEILRKASETEGRSIQERYENKRPDAGGFYLIRPLDCAVFENLHAMLNAKNRSFDTVYGYFQEGAEAFPTGGVREKSHIQICVRNQDCIKGYFRPRMK